MTLRRLPLLLALLLSPAVAPADVYKYYDAEGNLVLSDTVPEDDASRVEKITPQPVMTVPAVVPDGRRPRPPATPARPVAAAVADYVILVQSPAANATFPRGSEPVPVAVSVSPGLAPGHRLETLLDGAAGEFASLVPDDLDRGTHVLVARVVDAEGKVLKAVEVTFHIQQRSVLTAPNAPKPKPKGGK